MSPQVRPNRRLPARKSNDSVQEYDLFVDQVISAIQVPLRADLFFEGVSPTAVRAVYNKLKQFESSRVSCEYYAINGLFVLRAMPSPVHECVQDWFQWVINHMQQNGFISWRDWFDRISRNVGMDFKDFKDSHRGSWKQPDFAIRSMKRTLPNLVIETAFTQREESLQRKVRLWLEGSRGVVQVVIVVKMREGAVVSAEADNHSRSDSDISDGDDDNNGSIASMEDVLVQEDDLLVGPIQLSIELWRWRDGVYLDYQLDLPTVSADGLIPDGDEGTFTFPLKITDIYGASAAGIPNGRSPDEQYNVDAGTLVNFVKVFRPLLGRYRRLERES